MSVTVGEVVVVAAAVWPAPAIVVKLVAVLFALVLAVAAVGIVDATVAVVMVSAVVGPVEAVEHVVLVVAV